MTVKRLISWLLAAAMTLCLGGCGEQPAADPTEAVLSDVAKLLVSENPAPAPGSVGGEWSVIGLSRWDGGVEQTWLDSYYTALEDVLRQNNGVLDGRKYTEYSRAVVAVTALGKDPRNVAGYDLLLPLADYEQTCWQGINGPIWALIALDSGNWELPSHPEAPVQATRQMYLQTVLEAQQDSGGWGLAQSQPAGVDMTAMALQALAGYTGRPEVDTAVERALAWLVGQPRTACESVAQVLVALGELGLVPEEHGFSGLIEELLAFYREGEGFLHQTGEPDCNFMSTEQAFYALVSARRQAEGKAPLYRMCMDSAPSAQGGSCTFSISCANLLNNLEKLDSDKHSLVPADGWLLQETTVDFQPGESVFDLLQRVCRENNVHMEYVDTPLYNSAYIEGIGNLYEFDCGDLSGWNYLVNGWRPNYGCSRYYLRDGDRVEWVYTCDLGRDVGDGAPIA